MEQELKPCPIPEDLAGDWAQAQLDIGKPWCFMQIQPKKVIAWIDRISALETSVREHEETMQTLKGVNEVLMRERNFDPGAGNVLAGFIEHRGRIQVDNDRLRATIREQQETIQRLSERYAFSENQRLCVGECDGDLVAEPHEQNCPSYVADLGLRPYLYADLIKTLDDIKTARDRRV